MARFFRELGLNLSSSIADEFSQDLEGNLALLLLLLVMHV